MSHIGFDRRLNLRWLDAAASGIHNGKTVKEVASGLQRILTREVRGAEARRKTITVLMHIWGGADARASDLRNRASGIFPKLNEGERLWLHWGMSVVTYPFFHDVASVLGKLLRLQGDFRLSHLTRRISETCGERTTMVRALQRVVRTMVDWQVLSETETRGMYRGVEKRSTGRRELMLWLVEALLVANSNGCVPFEELDRLPAAFPFDLSVSLRKIERSKWLEVQIEGLRGPLVLLRRKPA